MNTLTGLRFVPERCKPTGGYPRPYGYTVRDNQPETYERKSEDIEGIGEWHYPKPYKRTTIHFKGWYKFKADAQKRADVLNRAAS